MAVNNLRTVTEIVRSILEDRPETRDDDDLLYLAVIGRRCVPGDITVEDFFTMRSYYKIPCFETVRRCRQKAQEEDETLKGKKVKKRAAAEEVYKEYSREKKNGK